MGGKPVDTNIKKKKKLEDGRKKRQGLVFPIYFFFPFLLFSLFPRGSGQENRQSIYFFEKAPPDLQAPHCTLDRFSSLLFKELIEVLKFET